MRFLKITTGKPYTGAIPAKVELPIHRDKPVPHTRIQIVERGDPGWRDALIRWMYLRGYAVVEGGNA